jgi:hypothetical protein
MRIDLGLFILVLLQFYSLLASMDNTGINFCVLPPETQETVFEHAMIACPHTAWKLTCVCKDWNIRVNNLHVVARVIKQNPPEYLSKLQVLGKRYYACIVYIFHECCEDPDVTEEDINRIFYHELPYPYVVSNQFALRGACVHSSIAAVNFLLNHKVIPDIHAFNIIIDKIGQGRNYTDAKRSIACFESLCKKNPAIAQSGEFLWTVYYCLSKKTERLYHTLRVLIDMKADVNNKDKDNDTILHSMYHRYRTSNRKESYAKIITLCLQHGASPYIKPKDEECVYELARHNEDQSFFAFINTYYKPIEKKD